MDITAAMAEIAALSVDERLQLVEAIWNSIAADTEHVPLSSAQLQEIERRLADQAQHPDDVVAWEDVRAQALARSRA